ncbi:MAG: DUF1257 domain-containing protein [Candidatus Rokuibacteriota bacterium]
MSEYVVIATVFTEARHLVDALVDLGFPPDTIEAHDGPVTLYGYRGDARPERAEIVIRREYVGRGSNDIGFSRQPDGVFRAIISEYDQRTPGACGPYDQAFLGRLAQAYSLRTIQHHYRARGYQVHVQRQSDGAVQVVAER